MGVTRWILAAALVLGGCSSSGDDDSGTPGGGAGTTGGGAGTTPAAGTSGGGEVSNDLQIVFNPMYSAYIEGGSHTFKIPAIVNGASGVTWEADPADSVDLALDDATGGVMITTKAAGDVTIIARAGVLSGSSVLHITPATEDDWMMGEARYNNGIPLPQVMIDLDAGLPSPDEISKLLPPGDVSCKNCHGSGAAQLDVEHTPQQTGGYSDDDLVKIFTMGMKPPGATFHTMIPSFVYTLFHTWEMTDAEKKGVVVYLRSLEPASQGALDFSGVVNRGGTGAAAGTP